MCTSDIHMFIEIGNFLKRTRKLAQNKIKVGIHCLLNITEMPEVLSIISLKKVSAQKSAVLKRKNRILIGLLSVTWSF